MSMPRWSWAALWWKLLRICLVSPHVWWARAELLTSICQLNNPCGWKQEQKLHVFSSSRLSSEVLLRGFHTDSLACLELLEANILTESWAAKESQTVLNYNLFVGPRGVWKACSNLSLSHNTHKNIFAQTGISLLSTFLYGEYFAKCGVLVVKLLSLN